MKKTPARLPRVLVVEDDPVLLKALSISFHKHLGIEVIVAEDGRRALEIIEAQQVDLVCLDLMLPDISGFRVFEHLRRSPYLRNIPVVVMSGRALPEDRARALELGAQSYLVKPFSFSALREKVTALLSSNERSGTIEASEASG
jgi:DNA-binding response OmpR family regulator